MKGTFFSAGQEYELETLGESWKQNDLVRGKINCKNGNPGDLVLVLAFGDFKDVRAKDHSAFEIIEEKKIEVGENLVSWQFKLRPDISITEKNGSPFVLLKQGENIIGHLQLTVELRPMLKSFLETFELFFRFKTHSFKNRKKGFVEYKMIPPKTREYANMDQVLVALKLAGDELEVKYTFTLKNLGMNAGQAELKKNKKEIEQTLSKKDYELCPDVHNPDGIKKFLADALAQAAPKMLF